MLLISPLGGSHEALSGDDCLRRISGDSFWDRRKESKREQLVYGVKVFAEFLVIGLVLGWILYFLPF